MFAIRIEHKLELKQEAKQTQRRILQDIHGYPHLHRQLPQIQKGLCS